jgi:hypothetical protein
MTSTAHILGGVYLNLLIGLLMHDLKRLTFIEIVFWSCIILKSKPFASAGLMIIVLRKFSLGLNLQLRFVVSSCCRLVGEISRLAIEQMSELVLHGAPLYLISILHALK